MSLMRISFTLNGSPVELDAEPLRRLVDVLRDDLGLTGTKEGCGEGECGACSVIVNGRLVNSCIMPAISAAGCFITTIEGFSSTNRFGLLKECFAEAGAVQCGFCTPGMMLAAEALLSRNPHPDEGQIKEAISGNLCRCTGYSMIVDAIMAASRLGEGLW